MYFGTYPEFQRRRLLFGSGNAELLLSRQWMAKGILFSGAGRFFFLLEFSHQPSSQEHCSGSTKSDKIKNMVFPFSRNDVSITELHPP
ncbi:hypothetical protein EZV62_027449 [Acer yangbiense]|uniref:Uncharacterized protein n=1 Tax=Acer yangbiense TaxID=1000413 RepID=A0A5C7GUD8_9ROSI|nr:hypothetical protein EZV62_027449 [Acer yangbiense]